MIGLTGTIVSLRVIANEKFKTTGGFSSFERAFLENLQNAIDTTVYGALIYFVNYLIAVVVVGKLKNMEENA